MCHFDLVWFDPFIKLEICKSVLFCFVISIHYIENTQFGEADQACMKRARCHFFYINSSFHRPLKFLTLKSTGLTLSEAHNFNHWAAKKTCFNNHNIIPFINILHIFPTEPPQFMITSPRKQKQTTTLKPATSAPIIKPALVHIEHKTTNLQTQPQPDQTIPHPEQIDSPRTTSNRF